MNIQIMLLIAMIVLIPADPSSAVAPLKTVCTYGVYSKGFRIGTITSSQHSSDNNGSHFIHFETKTNVKASFLWLRYNLDMVEKGILKNGVLVIYSRHGDENGERADVEGRLEDDVFRFEVKERSGVRSLAVSRRSYDATTMEFPEAQLDLHRARPSAIRVLDVERLAVVKREYRLHRETAYTVSGKDYPCLAVDFSDQNKSARRWIRRESNSAFMLRQDGTGNKGSYSVQAITVKEE